MNPVFLAVIVFLMFLAIMITVILLNFLIREGYCRFCWTQPWIFTIYDLGNDINNVDNGSREHVGLSDEEIDGLQCFEYRTKRGIQEHEEDCCSICLCRMMENEEARKLPQCTHYYHKKCIDKWLRVKRTCPNCNTPVLVEIHSDCHEAENAIFDDKGNLTTRENLQITTNINLRDDSAT